MLEDAEFSEWDQNERQAMKAYELFENGEMIKALRELENAIAVNPSDSALYFNKALTLDFIERFEDAIAEYEKVLDLSGEDVEVLNCLAVDYTRIGEYDRAIEIFEKIEKIEPTFEPAYCNRIITYTEMGLHDMAEQMFYMAQQINSACPLCYYNIGNSLFSREMYKKAIWCWEKTATLEPAHPQINYRIAQAQWAAGNMNLAQLYFIKELRNNPADIDVIFNFGIFLLDMEQIEAAKEKFNRILEFRPDYAPAMHYLGEIAAASGEIETANRWFIRATGKNPRLAGPQYRLAQSAIVSGRHQEAIDYLKEEMKLTPDDSDVLVSMGSMLLELNQPDYAINCLLRAIEKDNSNSDAFNYLGISQALRKEYRDALDFFRRACELRPDNIEAAKNWIACLLVMRDFEEADKKIRSMISNTVVDRELISLSRKIKFMLAVRRILDLWSGFRQGLRNYFK